MSKTFNKTETEINADPLAKESWKRHVLSIIERDNYDHYSDLCDEQIKNIAFSYNGEELKNFVIEAAKVAIENKNSLAFYDIIYHYEFIYALTEEEYRKLIVDSLCDAIKNQDKETTEVLLDIIDYDLGEIRKVMHELIGGKNFPNIRLLGLDNADKEIYNLLKNQKKLKKQEKRKISFVHRCLAALKNNADLNSDFLIDENLGLEEQKTDDTNNIVSDLSFTEDKNELDVNIKENDGLYNLLQDTWTIGRNRRNSMRNKLELEHKSENKEEDLNQQNSLDNVPEAPQTPKNKKRQCGFEYTPATPSKLVSGDGFRNISFRTAEALSNPATPLQEKLKLLNAEFESVIRLATIDEEKKEERFVRKNLSPVKMKLPIDSPRSPNIEPPLFTDKNINER